MQFRQYQDMAVGGVWDYFTRGGRGNPLVVMPTGTGKSLVIAKLMQTVMGHYPDQNLANVTHVKELIEQNHNQMQRLYPGSPTGIYSAGLDRREVAPITFAGIQSVAKRARLFQKTDLLLIDEAHLVSPNANTQYTKFIDGIKEFNPNLKVIGFTATPYRLGQGMLTDGGLFTDICVDQSTPAWFQYFIDNGWLSPLVPRKMDNTLDTSDIRVRGGEFMARDIEEEFEAQRITLGALTETYEVAKDRRKWLVFANSIDHTVECSEILSAMGVTNAIVHSKMSSGERDANLQLFRDGHVRCIINRDILTTGFDVPDIDCIVMLRPTQSPGLWVQMLGRGTRPAPNKKNCIVLDFAGNTARLGPIDDPVLPRARGVGGGVAPVKLCPDCATYVHASATVCFECGHEFPRDVSPKLTAEASNLALLSSEDMPQVEVFDVHSMIAEHVKARKDGTPMMRVSYYCGAKGVRRFTQHVCMDHIGFAKKKARDWWREHAYTDQQMADDPPENTDQAIAYFDQLFKPTHIRVWVNKKYPEIMAYDFTGTAFGKSPDNARHASRTAAVGVEREEPRPSTYFDHDEEIPF